jgi:DNA-binding MarR family transcriptional regulator
MPLIRTLLAPDPIPDASLLELCSAAQVRVWRTMRYLQRRSPEARPSLVEVAGILNLPRQAVSQHTARLYSAGLVECRPGLNRYLAILPAADAIAPKAAAPADALRRCTPRQRLIWQTMRDLQAGAELPRCPSRQEIVERIGGSLQSLTPHIISLVRVGLLQQRPGRSRYFALLPDSHNAPLAELEDRLDDDGDELDEVELGNPPPVDSFSERQRSIWSAMRQYQVQHGTAVPLVLLSRHLGFRHYQSLHPHFAQLAAGGYLRRERRSWLAIPKDQ